MKPLWFIGGMAVAAMLVAGIGVAAAYTGSETGKQSAQPATVSATGGGCGCSHGAGAGGCGAAGCKAGCTQCQNHAAGTLSVPNTALSAGGCTGGCHAGQK